MNIGEHMGSVGHRYKPTSWMGVGERRAGIRIDISATRLTNAKGVGVRYDFMLHDRLSS